MGLLWLIISLFLGMGETMKTCECMMAMWRDGYMGEVE